MIATKIEDTFFLAAFSGFLRPASVFVMIAAIIIEVIVIVGWTKESVEDRKKYKKEVEKEKNRLQLEDAEKEWLLCTLPYIEEDLNKTCELLNEAYDLNIIPAKFRNIYASYFLYEYISTSTATLNEALNQCAWDEISKKLDAIMWQQQEIIMQTARANALNEQIVRQNEETLRHAIATERNTALAAQYSRVAAINSETVATIQCYNFFKN